MGTDSFVFSGKPTQLKLVKNSIKQIPIQPVYQASTPFSYKTLGHSTKYQP
jgi:hypothetical protein